jgi:hypothetical protein
MAYKYGDTIRLKDGVMPQMSLDKETFFNLPDEEDDNDNKCCNSNGDKTRTYWGLPESAFETDDMGFVYLKSEYSKRLVWGVDDVIKIHDDFGWYEYDRLNINVAYDPECVVNSGAFCSFVNDSDVDTTECNDIRRNFEKDIGTVIEKKRR